MLNGTAHEVAGALGRFDTREFPISPVDLADQDGVIKVEASIGGNRVRGCRIVRRSTVDACMRGRAIMQACCSN